MNVNRMMTYLVSPQVRSTGLILSNVKRGAAHLRRNGAVALLVMASSVSASLTGCAQSPRPSAYTTAAAGEHDADSWRTNAEAADLIARGKYAATEQKLRKLLSKDSEFGPAHNNLGLAYYHQDKLYLAAWEFEYATKVMPRAAEPHNNLGLVLERGGRLDEAVQAYQKAASIRPDNPEFLANLARAKVKRGDTDAETRKLLGDIALKDARPEWRQWAQNRLMRLEMSLEPATKEGYVSPALPVVPRPTATTFPSEEAQSSIPFSR
jgi:Tfp pilus assembly protein PilF